MDLPKTWFGVQTQGYRPKHVATDSLLSLVSGMESVLWSCTFAAMIFSGALAGFLPVAILVLLASAALITIIIAVFSNHPLHAAMIDEQTVAIMATIAFAANARLDQFAGPAAAAATIFVVMGSVALLSGLGLHIAARFNIGPLIQLVPFPVVCGFLGGLGWLLFGAVVTMLTDIQLTPGSAADLLDADMVTRWAPAFAGGLGIFILLRLKNHFLLLPAALLAGLAGFFLIAFWQGASLESLRQDGWIFSFSRAETAPAGFGALDFAHVNFGFIASVLPEVATMVVLSLLNVFFNLSALEAGARTPLPLKSELRTIGSANIASGLVMGLPGISDIVGSAAYGKLGVTSRTFLLGVGAILAMTAVGGAGFLEFVPKAVCAAMVFFMAIHLVYDWLILARRHMTVPEAFAVWSIFAVIVAAGFMAGVVMGIVLTSLLFIVRYSRIDIVDSSFSLDQLSSSVHRSGAEVIALDREGKKAKILNLRGFIFFGTASTFYESIKRLAERESNAYVVLNFRRVTGMDSTAAHIFFKIVGFLETLGTSVVFCAMSPAVHHAFTQAEQFDKDKFLLLDDPDIALKWVEERLLAAHELTAGPADIRHVVTEIIGDRAKAERLVETMERLALNTGDVLFRQGDSDTSLYIIESGSIEVRLESSGRYKRLREFRQGTVIGEMAAYSDERTRTASAVAIAPSVVYRLASGDFHGGENAAPGSQHIQHEFVARLVVARLAFMNRRLALEL